MMVPAFNRAAEESVLGAILNAGAYSPVAGKRIVDRVRQTGLVADDFWIPSHSALYGILVRRADARLPLDAVSIAAEIEEQAFRALGSLAELALTHSVNVEVLRGRLECFAAGITAFSNVAHHAAIVVRNARRREAAA